MDSLVKKLAAKSNIVGLCNDLGIDFNEIDFSTEEISTTITSPSGMRGGVFDRDLFESSACGIIFDELKARL